MILFIRSVAWIFFRASSSLQPWGSPAGMAAPDPDRIRFIQGVQGGADRAGQLRKIGKHDRSADHLPGHFDQVRIVRHHPPGHDDPSGRESISSTLLMTE